MPEYTKIAYVFFRFISFCFVNTNSVVLHKQDYRIPEILGMFRIMKSLEFGELWRLYLWKQLANYIKMCAHRQQGMTERFSEIESLKSILQNVLSHSLLMITHFAIDTAAP